MKNRVNDFLPCFLCNGNAAGEFVCIEKNYDGETTSFLDLCKKCFDSSADDKLKEAVYNTGKYTCIYCDEPIENNMGEIIMGNKNANGNYCAVTYEVFKYVFMHIECYDGNIGL